MFNQVQSMFHHIKGLLWQEKTLMRTFCMQNELLASIGAFGSHKKNIKDKQKHTHIMYSKKDEIEKGMNFQILN